MKTKQKLHLFYLQEDGCREVIWSGCSAGAVRAAYRRKHRKAERLRVRQIPDRERIAFVDGAGEVMFRGTAGSLAKGCGTRFFAEMGD